MHTKIYMYCFEEKGRVTQVRIELLIVRNRQGDRDTERDRARAYALYVAESHDIELRVN